MNLRCAGCAGCCVDWRPLDPAAAGTDRTGDRHPLDDAYDLVPLTRDEVAAFLADGLADVLRPRLFTPAPADDRVAIDGIDVAAVDDRPVGYAIVIPGPETVAYLPELAVAPDRQREGYGSALLEYVCAELAGDGYDQLRLSVLAVDERARQFYDSCGFQRLERLPDEFERGDGILLATDLELDPDE
mgnify:CR=1 FL=1